MIYGPCAIVRIPSVQLLIISPYVRLALVAAYRTPHRKVKIPVRINVAHAQSAWMPFLNHVMHDLELEDIDGVYEDVDGAPVARIASLVDGGLYFARPTEVLWLGHLYWSEESVFSFDNYRSVASCP